VGVRLETFPDEVRRHFDFLVTEHDFTGPVEDDRPSPLDGHLTYAATTLLVTVGLALGPASDQNVETGLTLSTPTARIQVYLGELFAAAGLGPVSRVPIGAQTRRAMAKSIAAQGAALRQVLPMVLGPDGASLMRRTSGSIVRVRGPNA
jgi:hypothetical protein